MTEQSAQTWVRAETQLIPDYALGKSGLNWVIISKV